MTFNEDPQGQGGQGQQQPASQPPVEIYMRSSEQSKAKALLQKRFPEKIFIQRSVAQLAIAILIFFNTCLAITMRYHHRNAYDTFTGFWGGVPFGVTATLGLIVVQRPTKCSLEVYMVANVVCLFFFSPCVTYAGINSLKSELHNIKPGLFMVFVIEIMCGLIFGVISMSSVRACYKLGCGRCCCCCTNGDEAAYERDSHYVSYRVEQGCSTHVNQNAAAVDALAAGMDSREREMQDLTGHSRGLLLEDDDDDRGILEEIPSLREEEERGGSSFARL